LERLLEGAAAKTHEPRFAGLKEALEGKGTSQDGTGY
jgi:hypothetical protein